MKRFLLICEGMADEPVADLGGRTPLEAAKTPVMDRLAKEGRTGLASFAPRAFKPSPDAACLTALGYDPMEFYTGLAPLEALAYGIKLDDTDLVFRCDFVSELDGILVDAAAGFISSKETAPLVEILNQSFGTDKVRFHAAAGHKNFLVVRDARLAEELEDLECVPPSEVLGKPWKKFLPREKKQAGWAGPMIEQAKTALEAHEINRVRIDLTENPANIIWLWGQGRKPKLPTFRQQYGSDGVAIASADFVKGLAKAFGFEAGATLKVAPRGDFIFVYASSDPRQPKDLKTKIRRIEEFDALVGQVVAAAGDAETRRIGVASDLVDSTEKKSFLHGQVPFLMHGAGIAADASASFSEKTASQSAFTLEQGHQLMKELFK